MTFRFRIAFIPAVLIAFSGAAHAQDSQPAASVIAIPPFATAKRVDTKVGDTWSIANQISGLISADLKTSNAFIIADVKDVRTPSYPEVTAPAYPLWRSAGAKLLLSGFVNARDDGRLTIGCYVYDVQSGREVTRQGFAVIPADWRRAAHKCADAAYTKATGIPATFDSRIAYIARSGRDESPVKRLAIMDFDGANHSYLTSGDDTVLTPRWSPDADRIAYTSFSGGRLHVRIANIDTSNDRPLLPIGSDSFAPAFSADGRTVALSIAQAGNIDLFTVAADGGMPRRLTTSPAIDTSPDYSPDGARIAFVSDRSGSPQIYVMESDGSNQRRLSFGRGEFGSPAWSPDGQRIAFTSVDVATRRIGVMDADGSNQRIVSAGPADEQPSWSPDGERILFQHFDSASRRTLLSTVPASGGEIRSIPTPQGATDPAWVERKE